MKISTKTFGDEFNENILIFLKMLYHHQIDSRINEVARSCGNIRNEYMVNEIQKYWSTGYSIYIHYGAGHAAMQKPAIENFVRKTLLPS